MKSLSRLVVLVLALLMAAVSMAADTFMVLDIQGRGEVRIKLETAKAPKTTAHIIKLVEAGFYNGLRFHRAERIPRPFLVQVGDPNSKDGDLNSRGMGQGGTGATIPFEETGLSHVEGAVGLARDPSDKNSGDSQFYFMLSDNKFLDGKYTVFGQIVGNGLTILKSIDKGDRITTARIERK